MDSDYFKKERDFYLTELQDQIVPFWLKYARDEEDGGYYSCLRRDGTVFDHDKSTWALGRIAWSYAYLYNEFRQDPAWLDMALHGVEFMQEHAFDEAGHMYGALTREGKPLGPGTNAYHDLFAAQALAECFKATGDTQMLKQAKHLVFATTEHRIRVKSEAEMDDVTPKIILERALEKVPVPKLKL